MSILENHPSNTQAQSDDVRVIKRYKQPAYYKEQDGQAQYKGLFVDVETTGLNVQNDKIIELGCVLFTYNKSGDVYSIVEKYQSFQDPKQPIPEAITSLTGIGDLMVKNKQINTQKVEELLNQAQLVIAHNASFDRPVLQQFMPAFKNKPWACTQFDIHWDTCGIGSRKLDYLAYCYGFFYGGHRAIEDCLAGIHLLALPFPGTQRQTMSLLLEKARETTFRLWAVNAPFEKKDLLKARGYRWSTGENNMRRSWYADLSKETLADEKEFLENSIYGRTGIQLPTDKITALERYS